MRVFVYTLKCYESINLLTLILSSSNLKTFIKQNKNRKCYITIKGNFKVIKKQNDPITY